MKNYCAFCGNHLYKGIYTRLWIYKIPLLLKKWETSEEKNYIFENKITDKICNDCYCMSYPISKYCTKTGKYKTLCNCIHCSYLKNSIRKNIFLYMIVVGKYPDFMRKNLLEKLGINKEIFNIL